MPTETKLSVGIIGATGYTGAELARLLATHPHAEVVLATASGERAGQALSDIFPSLRGVCDVKCEQLDLDAIAARCRFVFIALGHGKAMEIVPQLLERGLKVCDLGADFRLRDAKDYEQWYKLSHACPDLLSEAVYGLPEWNREKIKGARLVANPGCYPTSAILSLAPFVGAGLIEEQSIIVDSASGVSGAGRSSFGIDYHFPEMHDNFKAYGVAGHRHTPEIEQGLQDALGNVSATVAITFTPHLLPIARGILSTCYANLKESHPEWDGGDAHKVLSARYADEPFVRVHPIGHFPQIKHVAGSNFCDIGVAVDERVNRLVVVAAEDNLVKGASGQAIQNMNLMCGFDETEGLQGAALFP